MRLTRTDFTHILLIALAVVALFHRFFLFGEMLLPPNAVSAYPWYATDAYTEPHPQGSMDAVRENYITWAHHDRYLANGDAPYWNPSIFAGNPLLANNFSIPYSPYKLLNHIFDAPLAWSWAQVLKLFFSGLFTYLAARALNRSATAATIAALTWMLSWPLAHQNQTTYNEGVHLLPALFFALLMCWGAGGWRVRLGWGLLAGLLAGFAFLMGNIQMTVYMFLLVLVFALVAPLTPHIIRTPYMASLQQYPTVAPHVGTGCIPSTRRPNWLWSSPRIRRAVIVMLVFTVGVIVGAGQIIPTYELLGYSIRGAAQTYQNRGVVPYLSVSFLNPWIYYWRNFEFPELRDLYLLNTRWNPYVGILPLLAFGLGLRFTRDATGRVIVGLCALAYLLLHILYIYPVFRALSGLPGYNLLDQARFLIVLPFPMALGAAYGLDWLLDSGRERWPRLRPMLWLAAGMLPIMLGGMLALMTYFDGELETAQAAYDSVLADENAGAQARFTAQERLIGTRLIRDYYRLDNPMFAVSPLYVVAALALIGGYASGRMGRRAAGAGFILLTAVDLIGFAGVNIAATERAHIYPATPAIQFLQNQPGVFRIMGAPNLLMNDATEYRDDHGWYLAQTSTILTPNTAGLYGLQDIRGYESVYTLAYSRYLARLDGQENPFGAGAWPSNTLTHPMLDALNLRYILSIQELDADGLQLVYEDEIRIYENLNVVPRVSLYHDYTRLPNQDAVLDAMSAPGFDPHTMLYSSEDIPLDRSDTLAGVGDSASATITAYEPNRVTLEASTPTPAILVLADQFYPGWNAYLDGEKIPVYNANYLFRAVVLPAGTHEVEFRYESRLVRGSVWVTQGAILGLVVGIVLSFYNKIKLR